MPTSRLAPIVRAPRMRIEPTCLHLTFLNIVITFPQSGDLCLQTISSILKWPALWSPFFITPQIGTDLIRQKPHRSKRCGFPSSRENQRLLKRRQAKPLHRSFRASPHSHGGASYAVTHSRRKYHHPRMPFVAGSSAKAACGAGVVRSIPPISVLLPRGTLPAHPPPGSTHTERICSPYSLVVETVSSP